MIEKVFENKDKRGDRQSPEVHQELDTLQQHDELSLK